MFSDSRNLRAATKHAWAVPPVVQVPCIPHPHMWKATQYQVCDAFQDKVPPDVDFKILHLHFYSLGEVIRGEPNPFLLPLCLSSIISGK